MPPRKPTGRPLAATLALLIAAGAPFAARAQAQPAPTRAQPQAQAQPQTQAPAPTPARSQLRAQTQATRPPVDPEVMKAMDRMGAFLRDQKVFELEARTSNDVILEDGTSVKFDGVNTYRAKRPDALFVDVATDRKARQFYYDGKTLTVYAPRVKYYAQVPAPGTIKAMLDKVQEELGMTMPLADLFYWGTPESGLDQLQSAQYVGYAKVDGVDTDQYVFRQPGADWQLWIERGDRPLPRKLVIIHTDQAERPQYEARLDWRLRPNFTADVFSFSPPADAKPIKIVPLGAVEEGAAP